MEPADDISAWPEALEAVVAASRWFDRARVVRETESTQDAARAAAGGRAGLVLVAGRQTRGRGRLGRVWEQRGDLGVALTAVVRGTESERLSKIGALAAWTACWEALAGFPAEDHVRIKAPNDVVLDAGDGRPTGAGFPDGPERGRKLAGVLIEQADGLAMIGIGVNVLQREEDFGDDLRGSACSLAMLGSPAARIDVIVSLVEALSWFLRMDSVTLTMDWDERLVD